MRLWFGLAILIVGLGAAIAADTIPATGGNIELNGFGDASEARDIVSGALNDYRSAQ